MKVLQRSVLALLLGVAIVSTGCQQPREDRSRWYDSQFYLSHFIVINGLLINGEVDPNYTPEGTFVGEPLQMQVLTWDSTGVSIAFRVGEDRSRTWFITREQDGRLHLRHDHRDPDGTPHDLTDYGGYGYASADYSSCDFAADDATAAMLPEAATNIWTMEFDFDNDRFIYNLTRHGAPRFRAVFDLTTARLPAQDGE